MHLMFLFSFTFHITSSFLTTKMFQFNFIRLRIYQQFIVPFIYFPLDVIVLFFVPIVHCFMLSFLCGSMFSLCICFASLFRSFYFVMFDYASRKANAWNVSLNVKYFNLNDNLFFSIRWANFDSWSPENNSFKLKMFLISWKKK